MDMGTSYKSNISIANSLEYNKTKPKPETLKFEKKNMKGGMKHFSLIRGLRSMNNFRCSLIRGLQAINNFR